MAAICADWRYGSRLLASRAGIALGATLELLVRLTSAVIASSLYRYVPGAVVEVLERLGCWYMLVDKGRSRMFCAWGMALRAWSMGAAA
jgi:hypothetical protein